MFDDDAYSDITEATDIDSIPSLRSVSDSEDSNLQVPSHTAAGRHTIDEAVRSLGASRVAAIGSWTDDIIVESNGPEEETHRLQEIGLLEDEVDEVDVHNSMHDIATSATAFIATESKHLDVYDSGASDHMSPFRDSFLSFRETAPRALNAANQHVFQAVGVGDMVIDVPNGPAHTQIHLTRVLYTPALTFNLVSIGRIDDTGYTTTFSRGWCIIADCDGQTVSVIEKTRGLYLVPHPTPVHGAANAATKADKLTIMDLHRRLGHIAPRAIRELVSKGRISGVILVPSEEAESCNTCVQAKSTCKPVPDEREGERAEELGEEVHSDLWGAARTVTLGGRKYYVTFTDDATRWTLLYLLRLKSEVFTAFKSFKAWLDVHHAKRIGALNTNRGGEYLSEEFKAYLEERGIVAKLSMHDTHEEAGVLERLNCTLMEKVRAMLIASGLPTFLWGEAVMHAVWLKNRTSTKALGGRTPYEALHGHPPVLTGLPVWGCRVWVHDTSTGKVGVRVKAAHWVGYDLQSKGHRVYWPDTQRVTVKRNVRFGEHDPTPLTVDDIELEGEHVETASNKPESVASEPEEPEEPSLEQPSDTEDVPDEPHTPPMPPHVDPLPPPAPCISRIRKLSHKVSEILEGRSADKHVPRGVQVLKETLPVEPDLVKEVTGAAMAAHIADVEGLDPRSLEEAKCRPEWPRWKEAMEEEQRALEAHRTWRLEKPPAGVNIVSC